MTTKKTTAKPKTAAKKSKSGSATAAKAARKTVQPSKKAVSKAKAPPKKAAVAKTSKPEPKVASKPVGKAAAKPSAKPAATPATKTAAKSVVKAAPAAKNAAPTKAAPTKAAATKAAAPAKTAAPKSPAKLMVAKPELTLPPPLKFPPSGAHSAAEAARRAPEQPKKKKPGKGLTPQQKDRMKDLLLERRKEILDRATPNDQGVEMIGDSGGDSADRASTSVDKDFLAETQARDAKALQDIDGALAKIASGSYGVCEECGCVIGLKRLEYLPNVAYCIDCQEKFEEQGMFPESMGERHDDFRLVD